LVLGYFFFGILYFLGLRSSCSELSADEVSSGSDPALVDSAAGGVAGGRRWPPFFALAVPVTVQN
jgi:hypothetical protein